MNDQTNVALRILSDIYGYPQWEKNTKDGQNADEIIKIWAEELGNYTIEQVKNACYRVAKFRKSMTFPTISHIMAELVDEKKKDEYSLETGNVKAAQKMYAYLINNSSAPKLASQRTIWNLYHVEVDGYKQEEDKQ